MYGFVRRSVRSHDLALHFPQPHYARRICSLLTVTRKLTVTRCGQPLVPHTSLYHKAVYHRNQYNSGPKNQSADKAPDSNMTVKVSSSAGHTDGSRTELPLQRQEDLVRQHVRVNAVKDQVDRALLMKFYLYKYFCKESWDAAEMFDDKQASPIVALDDMAACKKSHSQYILSKWFAHRRLMLALKSSGLYSAENRPEWWPEGIEYASIHKFKTAEKEKILEAFQPAMRKLLSDEISKLTEKELEEFCQLKAKFVHAKIKIDTIELHASDAPRSDSTAAVPAEASAESHSRPPDREKELVSRKEGMKELRMTEDHPAKLNHRKKNNGWRRHSNGTMKGRCEDFLYITHPRTVIVLDTNIVLDPGEMDRLLDKTNAAILIPWVVLNELEHLKKKGLVEKVNPAAKLLTWYTERIYFQSPQQKAASMRVDGAIWERMNDDSIVNCALFWAKRHPNRKVVVMTLDLVVQLKARACGVEPYTPATILDAFDKIPRHPPARKEEGKEERGVETTSITQLARDQTPLDGLGEGEDRKDNAEADYTPERKKMKFFVCVQNLPFKATADDLREVFPEAVVIDVPKFQQNRRNFGIAAVAFRTKEEVVAALKNEKYTIHGRRLALTPLEDQSNWFCAKCRKQLLSMFAFVKHIYEVHISPGRENPTQNNLTLENSALENSALESLALGKPTLENSAVALEKRTLDNSVLENSAPILPDSLKEIQLLRLQNALYGFAMDSHTPLGPLSGVEKSVLVEALSNSGTLEAASNHLNNSQLAELLSDDENGNQHAYESEELLTEGEDGNQRVHDASELLTDDVNGNQHAYESEELLTEGEDGNQRVHDAAELLTGDGNGNEQPSASPPCCDGEASPCARCQTRDVTGSHECVSVETVKGLKQATSGVERLEEEGEEREASFKDSVTFVEGSSDERSTSKQTTECSFGDPLNLEARGGSRDEERNLRDTTHRHGLGAVWYKKEATIVGSDDETGMGAESSDRADTPVVGSDVGSVAGDSGHSAFVNNQAVRHSSASPHVAQASSQVTYQQINEAESSDTNTDGAAEREGSLHKDSPDGATSWEGTSPDGQIANPLGKFTSFVVKQWPTAKDGEETKKEK